MKTTNVHMADDKIVVDLDGHRISLADDAAGWKQFRNLLLQRSVTPVATIGMEASPIQYMVDQSRKAVKAFEREQLERREAAKATLRKLGMIV